MVLALDAACLLGATRDAALHEQLVNALARRIAESPSGLIETYPGEIYVPDNVVLMAALVQFDACIKEPRHAELTTRWIATMKSRWLDPANSLLVFAPGQPARGSGASWNSFFLPLIDEPFAAEQSELMWSTFGDAALGGWLHGLREWPVGEERVGDVDSGSLVMGVSPSATGVALADATLRARATQQSGILRTAELVGVTWNGRYLCAPLVGDAIVLAARTMTRWVGEDPPRARGRRYSSRWMIKPLSGVDRVTRLVGIAEAPPVQPAPAVLAPATWRTATSPVEEALRAALHQFAAALGHVETQTDPLTRHLGFRTIRRELNDAAVTPQSLSDPEEQDWAQGLVDSVRVKEQQTLGSLDAQARLDLEVLLHFEQRLDERHAADVRRKAASEDQVAQRAVVSRLERDTERRRLDFAKLESSRRPLWARVLGVVIAICSCGVLALRLEFDASPLLNGVTLVGVIFSGLLGSWLALDSRQRGAWLRERLEELATLRQSAAEREALAKEHLTHALELFDEVDAQCQREEAAARAVLLRLPGAARYLRTSGPVVAFSAR